jgi:hypothetical protein
MSENGLVFTDEREEYLVTAPAHTDWEEAWLDGMHLWVRANRMTNLARFEPKITFGDNTAASDALESNWNIRDFSGGMLYGELNEGSDTERYRIGNAETRFPHQLCQNAETLDFALPGYIAGTSGPLGDFQMGVERWLLGHFDEKLARFDHALQIWEDLGANLGAMPTGKGIVYRDDFYIPCGGAGYRVWDGAALIVGTAGVTPLNFTLWDDKLIALEHDGQLNIFDGTAWITDVGWLDRIKLHGDQIPRHVVTWWNPQREPTIFVITHERVFSYDPVAQLLYPTGLHFPRHNDQGLAVSTWRDDNLYVSVGIGMHQMSTGQVISAVGLDRGDGTALPVDLRGRIIDAEPEYNGLIVIVEGAREEAGSPPTLMTGRVLEESSTYEDPVTFGPLPGTAPTPSRGAARAAVYRYTGIGWHPVWEANEVIGVPTRAYVSMQHDRYELWWGYGGRMFRQVLRRGFHNPRVGIQAGIDRFAQTAYLYTGRFDATMSGFDKSADLLEVITLPEHRGTIDVFYETDRRGRTYLGQAAQPNARQILPFDPNGDGYPEGDIWRWIEFEFRLNSPERTHACLMDGAILRFIKLPITTFSFTFDIAFRDDDPGSFGWGPQEALDNLNAMATSFRFVLFKHRKRSYRVRVAQVNGDLRSGQDLRNVASLSLVQCSYQGAPW